MIHDLVRVLFKDDDTLFEIVEELVVTVTQDFSLNVKHSYH